MNTKARSKDSKNKLKGAKEVVAINRRARFDYFIEEELEAGLLLQGSEVKSLRRGQASIVESHIFIRDNEAMADNLYISENRTTHSAFGHETKRRRKLLLKRREINRLSGLVQRKGYTMVPLSLYFNDKGIAKLSLGLAKGKKQEDKRETIKQREWDRSKSAVLKRQLQDN